MAETNVGILAAKAVLHMSNEIGLMNVAFFVLAVIGIAVSIFLYFKSNKTRKPVYLIKNLLLFKDKIDTIDSLNIQFAGREISSFSVAHVAIWNAGRDTININDIAQSDPLRVVGEEGVEILGAKIIFHANPANDFKVRLYKTKKSRISITFDYFDIHEGIILQVFHTGKTNECIKVEGSIKKAGVIKCANDSLLNKFGESVHEVTGLHLIEKIPNKYKKIVLSLTAILLPTFPLLIVTFPSLNEPLSIKQSLILSLILLLVYWPLCFFLLKRRVPKNFTLFEEI